MKEIFYKFFFRMVLLTGILIGVLRGQEARAKWVNKKKMKYEARKGQQNGSSAQQSLVMLDDIEMSTYHS